MGCKAGFLSPARYSLPPGAAPVWNAGVAPKYYEREMTVESPLQVETLLAAVALDARDAFVRITERIDRSGDNPGRALLEDVRDIAHSYAGCTPVMCRVAAASPERSGTRAGS